MVLTNIYFHEHIFDWKLCYINYYHLCFKSLGNERYIPNSNFLIIWWEFVKYKLYIVIISLQGQLFTIIVITLWVNSNQTIRSFPQTLNCCTPVDGAADCLLLELPAEDEACLDAPLEECAGGAVCVRLRSASHCI